jgi:hypothetical protein
MSSLAPIHELPTTVPSTPASTPAENESNDNVVATLTLYDRPSEETNPPAHTVDAKVEGTTTPFPTFFKKLKLYNVQRQPQLKPN